MTISIRGTARTLLPRLTGSNCRESAHRKVHCGDRLIEQSVQPMPRKIKRVCSVRDHLPLPGQKHAPGHRKVVSYLQHKDNVPDGATYGSKHNPPLLCSPSNPHMLFPSNSKPGQMHLDEETRLQIHTCHWREKSPT